MNCAAKAAASTSVTAYRLSAFSVMARVWVMRPSERQFQRIGRVVQIGRGARDQDGPKQAERQWARTAPGDQHHDSRGQKQNSEFHRSFRKRVMGQSMIDSPAGSAKNRSARGEIDGA